MWGEKKGVGSTLGDHAYRLTNAEQKANAEQYAREQADLALDAKITAEATTRGQQFQSLVNDLASEVATRQADVFQVQQSAQIEKNARNPIEDVTTKSHCFNCVFKSGCGWIIDNCVDFSFGQSNSFLKSGKKFFVFNLRKGCGVVFGLEFLC
jgi:hypothetical protein